MVDRSNSDRLRGLVTDGQTDRQTDICDYRVAFATEKRSDEKKIRSLLSPIEVVHIAIHRFSQHHIIIFDH